MISHPGGEAARFQVPIPILYAYAYALLCPISIKTLFLDNRTLLLNIFEIILEDE